jgi:cyclophilin family peptidyl-prolyl cis-trans isomerase
MCNKRIRFDKYNDGVNIMASRFSFISVIIALLMMVSCTNRQPVYQDDVILEHYPEMAETISSRNAMQIFTFTRHEDTSVRSLAWRALAHSTIETPDLLLSSVISQNEHAAWVGLSKHELSRVGLGQVRNLFSENPNEYMFACEVFKRQGGEQDLLRILGLMDELGKPNLCSTAAGRLLTYEEYSDETLQIVIDKAFSTESADIRKNLLYGFYRSTVNRPEYRSDLWNRMRDEWIELGIGMDPMTDQYMIGILGEEGADMFVQGQDFPADVRDVQLLIEVIRSMPMDDSYVSSNQNAIVDLLSHKNPTVVTEMLERLKINETLNEQLINQIYSHHIQRTRNAVNFVTALELLIPHGVDISPIRRKLDSMSESSPYLTNRTLAIYSEIESPDEYLERIRENLNQGGIRGAHAAQLLTEYWIGLEDQEQSDQVRSLMREATEAARPSVVSGLSTLLTDENLVTDEDYKWLASRYEKAVNTDNRSNMTVFQQALEARFPEQAGEFTEPEEEPFRIPNWERLFDMGTQPYWHLKTEKGEIVIRLNPLSAPFTVSSLDSLTRAGAYDGIAFHRVVHNFVIQGGDVGRGDGFGGPGYRIPTEPSLHSFERGAVGIASSGTDTEGSQYFVMHQWKPHLDVEYTRFGTVVRGMDVVDRIQIGDIVEEATISVH